MADDAEKKAGSWLRRLGLAVVVIGGLAAWYMTMGFVTVNPGEHAVVLRLGAYAHTLDTEGLHPLLLPRPISTVQKVRVDQSRRREFGDVNAEDPATLAETAMQTSDNNIIHIEFVVQYRINDAFQTLYKVSELEDLLADTAQAAMREVVGRSTADAIIAEQKDMIGRDAGRLLQQVLTNYEAGIEIERIAIQDVQPPPGVREAFDDVLAASQDRSRLVNEAESYANEILPKARGEAAELLASASAYRDVKVADSTGEADRFRALLVEYQKAPAITRKRLYIETMEQILPDVEKIIIDSENTPVLPYLPLGSARPVAGGGGR